MEETAKRGVSPNIFRMIKSRMKRWAEHEARTGELINAKKKNILVGKQEAERPVVRFRIRGEDNIRKDLRKIRSEIVK